MSTDHATEQTSPLQSPQPGDVILGSRSPRREELLSLLVPAERIRIVTAPDESEAGFEPGWSMEQVLQQLAAIARAKNDAVLPLLEQQSWNVLVTADTVVIVQDAAEVPHVLGKPDGDTWQQTTRFWFENYYSGRTHQVATGVCLRTPTGELREFQVLTEVTFAPVTADMLEWYLQTGEPVGKAGGYGLQGAGGVFVEQLSGSPSNVIGLPLRETWQHLQSLGIR